MQVKLVVARMGGVYGGQGDDPPNFEVGDKVSYIPQYFHGAKNDFYCIFNTWMFLQEISARAEVGPTARRPFRAQYIS
jgi:hypothetical protein